MPTAGATAVAFGWLGIGWSWATIGVWLVMVGLVAAATVDIDTHRLPNRLLYPTAAAGFGALVTGSIVIGEADRIVTGAVGAVFGFALFFVFWFVRPDDLGFGDVRLAAIIGGVSGMLGWSSTLVALLVGTTLAAVAGVVVAVRHRSHRVAFPQGPFLVIGLVVAVALS
jgi:leader peptidase (prepilin peptidase)/N-methyltransferase